MVILKNDFKTIQLAAYFTDLDEQHTLLYRFLLSRLLASHTPSLDTKRRMNEHLEFLYGAYFSTNIYRLSDLNVIRIALTFPDPKIVEDATLLKRAASLFASVIDRRDSFKADLFREEVRMIKEQWETLKDRKRLYAQMEFYRHFFKGDSYAIPVSGSREQLETVRLDGLYAYYRDVFLNNPRIFIASGRISSKEEADLRALFSAKEKRNERTPNLSFREPRKELLKVEERTDMQQAILRIGYHIPVFRDDPLYTATVILDFVIGGYPESRLFKEIREKAGLCYDIQSAYDPYKGVLMVSSGVDSSLRDQALRRIREEVERVRSDGITESELSSASMYYINYLRSSLDRQAVLTHRAFIKEVLGRDESVEERIVAIRNTTIAEVRRAAEKLTIDTVYVLYGGEGT
ncbi:MAG: M16 family metallopeptidase [Acholeplasmataceae bacterium]